jgi:hypothetical protein
MGAPSPGRGPGNLSLAFACFQRILFMFFSTLFGAALVHAISSLPCSLLHGADRSEGAGSLAKLESAKRLPALGRVQKICKGHVD